MTQKNRCCNEKSKSASGYPRCLVAIKAWLSKKFTWALGTIWRDHQRWCWRAPHRHVDKVTRGCSDWNLTDFWVKPRFLPLWALECFFQEWERRRRVGKRVISRKRARASWVLSRTPSQLLCRRGAQERPGKKPSQRWWPGQEVEWHWRVCRPHQPRTHWPIGCQVTVLKTKEEGSEHQLEERTDEVAEGCGRKDFSRSRVAEVARCRTHARTHSLAGCGPSGIFEKSWIVASDYKSRLCGRGNLGGIDYELTCRQRRSRRIIHSSASRRTRFAFKQWTYWTRISKTNLLTQSCCLCVWSEVIPVPNVRTQKQLCSLAHRSIDRKNLDACFWKKFSCAICNFDFQKPDCKTCARAEIESSVLRLFVTPLTICAGQSDGTTKSDGWSSVMSLMLLWRVVMLQRLLDSFDMKLTVGVSEMTLVSGVCANGTCFGIFRFDITRTMTRFEGSRQWALRSRKQSHCEGSEKGTNQALGLAQEYSSGIIFFSRWTQQWSWRWQTHLQLKRRWLKRTQQRSRTVQHKHSWSSWSHLEWWSRMEYLKANPQFQHAQAGRTHTNLLFSGCHSVFLSSLAAFWWSARSSAVFRKRVAPRRTAPWHTGADTRTTLYDRTDHEEHLTLCIQVRILLFWFCWREHHFYRWWAKSSQQWLNKVVRFSLLGETSRRHLLKIHMGIERHQAT